jgi:hypothetical protein
MATRLVTFVKVDGTPVAASVNLAGRHSFEWFNHDLRRSVWRLLARQPAGGVLCEMVACERTGFRFPSVLRRV